MERDGNVFTAVLWRRGSRPGPLVMLGHGGSGHKSSPRTRDLAERLAVGHGISSLAIDSPLHGERTPAGVDRSNYQEAMIAAGLERFLNGVASDWQAALDAVSGLADTSRLGYVGVSMGTRLGLPLLARLTDGPLRAAVLGKFGLVQQGLHPALQTNRQTVLAARAVTAPVHFHAQEHDQIFPLDGQRQLFSQIGSAAKTWRQWPGPHGEMPVDAADVWCEFISSHL